MSETLEANRTTSDRADSDGTKQTVTSRQHRPAAMIDTNGTSPNTAKATRDRPATLAWVSKAIHAMLSSSQANHAALLKSNQILVNGAVDATENHLTGLQAQFEQIVTGWKELAIAKSFKEVLELQFSLTHEFLGLALKERGKLALSVIDLSRETSLPIIDRLASAREEFSNQD
jgi:hypothetical protein